MRIAFLSSWDVDDPRAWSGVVHRMYGALAARTDTVSVNTGDIRPAFVDRVACRLSDSIGDRRYLVGHAVPTSIKRGLIVKRRIMDTNPDVVLAVVASQDVAFLRIDRPIVLVSDATFQAIRGYYPLFARLNRLSSIQGEIQEARSLRNAEQCAVASHWAQRSIVSDYAVSPDKSSVVPFGPALEPKGPYLPRSSSRDHLRLLVVATDWVRKGGDRSLAVFQELRRQGLAVSLTVVGDAPELPRDVAAVGRVDSATMAELYTSHDVLLELARANCAGVTLTDAAAFGMPVVATDTGGVSSIVQDGFTGFLVDPSNDVAATASEAIKSLLAPGAYAEMSTLARLRYETRLNWDTWAHDILTICREARL